VTSRLTPPCALGNRRHASHGSWGEFLGAISYSRFLHRAPRITFGRARAFRQVRPRNRRILPNPVRGTFDLKGELRKAVSLERNLNKVQVV